MLLADALLALGERGVDAIRTSGGGRRVRVHAGQTIYSALDPLDEVYLLLEGEVRLYVSAGEENRSVLLLRAPALFGDRDVLAGLELSLESAVSLSVAELLCYPKEALEAALARPEVAKLLWRDSLLRQARASRLAAFLLGSLEARILAVLWDRAGNRGAELPAQAELAVLTEATPKSVGRSWSRLKTEGSVVEAEPGRYTLAPATAEELEAEAQLSLFHSWGSAGAGKTG